MEFTVETADGKKSIDRKIQKLLKYVNYNINALNWKTEEDAIGWGREVIEGGIRNIMTSCIACLK